MAVKELRKESDIPNISKEDDYRAFKYATKDFNGVIQDFGNACSYSISDNVLHINSGEIIFNNEQWDIDGNGVDVVITKTQTTSFYCVGARKNMVTNEIEIGSFGYATRSGDADDIIKTNTNTFWLYKVRMLANNITDVYQVFNLLNGEELNNFFLTRQDADTDFVKKTDFITTPTIIGEVVVSKKVPLISSPIILNKSGHFILDSEIYQTIKTKYNLSSNIHSTKLQLVWAEIISSASEKNYRVSEFQLNNSGLRTSGMAQSSTVGFSSTGVEISGLYLEIKNNTVSNLLDITYRDIESLSIYTKNASGNVTFSTSISERDIEIQEMYLVLND